MRNAVLLLLCIQFSSALMGQTFEWVQSTSNSSLWSIGRSITHDLYGNVYVAGAFQGEFSMPGRGGVLSVTSNGGYDIFILKLSPAGQPLWLKSVGSADHELKETLTWKPHIATDQQGSLYLSCTFSDTVDLDPGIGVEERAPVSGKDLFILKLDSDGNFLYAHAIGGKGDDEVKGLEISPANQLLVFGNFESTVDFDPGHTRKSVAGSNDIFILCLDSIGGFEWVETYGEANLEERIKDVDLTPTGLMVVSGVFHSHVSFDPQNPKLRLFSDGIKDDFLLCLNQEAKAIWVKQIVSGDDLYWNSRVSTNENSIYYLTTFQDTLLIGEDQEAITSPYDFSAVIAKINIRGSLDWTNVISSPEGVEMDGLAADGCGNVTAVGKSLHHNLSLTHSTYSEYTYTVNPNDYLLLRLGAYGTRTMIRTFGDSTLPFHQDAGYAIAIEPRGSLLITGQFSGTVDFNHGPDTVLAHSYIKHRPGTSAFIHKVTVCGRNDTHTLQSMVCRGNSFTFPDGHLEDNIQGTREHGYLDTLCSGCTQYIQHTLKLRPERVFNERRICQGDSIPGGEIMDRTAIEVDSKEVHYGCPVSVRTLYKPVLADASITAVGRTFIAEQYDGFHAWKDCSTDQWISWGYDRSDFAPDSESTTYLHYIYNDGCEDTSECVSIEPIIEEEVLLEDPLTIYPNPSQGQVRISNADGNFSQIDILDARGSIVKHQSGQNEAQLDIDLRDLSNGVYFLHAYSSATDDSMIRKIVLDQ